MTSGQHISYKISDFLRISKEEFTGRLRNEDNQIRTWDNEYEHLQEVLHTRQLFLFAKRNHLAVNG